MRVTTLSIGDELIRGAILDRHAGWFADRFESLGCRLVEHRTVGDDRAGIARSFRELAAMSDLLVATGGLGPTTDDLTRDALAEALGDVLVTDDAAMKRLEANAAARGRNLTESNRRQALRPTRARCLSNSNGTAPGLEVELDGCRILVLPGPPHEMHPMFEANVVAGLDIDPGREEGITINAFGLPESRAGELLGPILDRDRDPLVGIKVSRSVLDASVRGRGVEPVAGEIERLWHPFAFGRGESTLQSVVGELLAARGMTVATAESCTGGLIGGRLTEVAGSSSWYLGGAVTYADEAKHRQLGVPMSLIESHGAVSEEVAVLMALECARRFGADCALSTTGIAGPGGGSEEKPVGTVWIGLCIANGQRPLAFAKRFVFPGDRDWVRDRTVKSALQMLRLRLLDEETGLLWEVDA